MTSTALVSKGHLGVIDQVIVKSGEICDLRTALFCFVLFVSLFDFFVFCFVFFSFLICFAQA